MDFNLNLRQPDTLEVKAQNLVHHKPRPQENAVGAVRDQIPNRGPTKRKGFSGHYYFGEYLSQGALKIEGKCQIVSAQTLMDRGLFRIRSEFEHFAGWTPRAKPPWTKPVIKLRESFYISKTERPGISEEGLQATKHCSNNCLT